MNVTVLHSNNMFNAVIIMLAVVMMLSVVLVTSEEQSINSKDAAHTNNFFKDKCRSHVKQGEAYMNFTRGLDMLNSCTTRGFYSASANSTTFCLYEVQALHACVSSAAADFAMCLSEEEKYLAAFLSNSTKYALDYLCDQEASNLKSVFSSEGRTCIEKLMASTNQTNVQGCFDRIFPARNGILNKSDLCTSLGVARECYVRHMGEVCSNSNIATTVTTGLLDSIRKPCNSGNMSKVAVSYIVYLGLVVIIGLSHHCRFY